MLYFLRTEEHCLKEVSYITCHAYLVPRPPVRARRKQEVWEQSYWLKSERSHRSLDRTHLNVKLLLSFLIHREKIQSQLVPNHEHSLHLQRWLCHHGRQTFLKAQERRSLNPAGVRCRGLQIRTFLVSHLSSHD